MEPARPRVGGGSRLRLALIKLLAACGNGGGAGAAEVPTATPAKAPRPQPCRPSQAPQQPAGGALTSLCATSSAVSPAALAGLPSPVKGHDSGAGTLRSSTCSASTLDQAASATTNPRPSSAPSHASAALDSNSPHQGASAALWPRAPAAAHHGPLCDDSANANGAAAALAVSLGYGLDPKAQQHHGRTLIVANGTAAYVDAGSGPQTAPIPAAGGGGRSDGPRASVSVPPSGSTWTPRQHPPRQQQQPAGRPPTAIGSPDGMRRSATAEVPLTRLAASSSGATSSAWQLSQQRYDVHACTSLSVMSHSGSAGAVRPLSVITLHTLTHMQHQGRPDGAGTVASPLASPPSSAQWPQLHWPGAHDHLNQLHHSVSTPGAALGGSGGGAFGSGSRHGFMLNIMQYYHQQRDGGAGPGPGMLAMQGHQVGLDAAHASYNTHSSMGMASFLPGLGLGAEVSSGMSTPMGVMSPPMAVSTPASMLLAAVGGSRMSANGGPMVSLPYEAGSLCEMTLPSTGAARWCGRPGRELNANAGHAVKLLVDGACDHRAMPTARLSQAAVAVVGNPASFTTAVTAPPLYAPAHGPCTACASPQSRP